MTINQVIHSAAIEVSQKLAGISHLLQNYKSEGSRDRDNEDIHGLGQLMEDLSGQIMDLANLIDSSEDVDRNAVVKIGRYDRDRIALAEALVKQIEPVKGR